MWIEFALCDLHGQPAAATKRFLLALNFDMHHDFKDSPETPGTRNVPFVERALSQFQPF